MSAIERLLAWDTDVSRLATLREELRRRPEFPAAVRRLAANIVADAEADPALAGMMKDAGRSVAGLSAAHLGAAGGLTLARLKDFIAGFGLVSRGRARALLAHMQYLGYVEPDPARPGDRPAAYRMTPRFFASYLRHQASLLDAVQMIEPAADLVRLSLAAPGVMDTLVGQQAAAFAAGSRQARPFDTWYRVFMHRLAGIQILHALVARADAFPPAAPIAFSAAETARQFGVSRVHVSRMMMDAERHGFVEMHPDGVCFTDAGREALDWLYASRLCVNLVCVARTLKAHPELMAQAAA